MIKLTIIFLTIAVISASSGFGQVPSLDDWDVHDLDRPQPPIVSPRGHLTSSPPSDAIILFDGTNLEEWTHTNGVPATWVLTDGYMEVAPGSGTLQSKRPFGDVQLHIEWATPNSGTGQDSGNSGVYLMSTYEVQILNSYSNQTYPDGQAASLYGQYPPLVNASLPPLEWQSYDIIFRRPHFNDDGSLKRPAIVTVLHNGILVQDNIVLTGPTDHRSRPPYRLHDDKLPILLQDHNEPTRFRNIWVRDLENSSTTDG
ncbi:MAG: DUF1080 domain-containing protein [Bacteroidetes bacterium]|nr:DUF1080 domain-containing protein [Bacteroidota bacterium]